MIFKQLKPVFEMKQYASIIITLNGAAMISLEQEFCNGNVCEFLSTRITDALVSDLNVDGNTIIVALDGETMETDYVENMVCELYNTYGESEIGLHDVEARYTYSRHGAKVLMNCMVRLGHAMTEDGNTYFIL